MTHSISKRVRTKIGNIGPERICSILEKNLIRRRTTLPSKPSDIDKTFDLDAQPFSTIPGPGGLSKLPYIGPLFLFHPFSNYKPETYGALVRSLHDKYGPIFKTRLGRGYTVHTSSVEDIALIFQQEPEYPERRLNILNRVYRQRRGLPQGLGTSNGLEWYQLRRSLNVPLNRSKACMAYLQVQNEVTDDFIDLLQNMQKQREGKKIPAKELFDLFFRFSAESVAGVCFNERLGFLTQDADSHDTHKLLDAIYTHLNCSFKAMIGLERKFLWSENDSFFQKYASAMDYIRDQSTKYVRKTIEAARGNERNSADSVESHVERGQNMLMSLLETSGLEMQQILAIIESLMIAGTDSAARNLSVIFYNLAMHPDVQTRASKEVIQILGQDNPISAESLAQMSFVKACVKESMRLYPPISPGPERVMSQDIVLSGYRVPEGTSVIMASVKTCVDPVYFPQPHSYRPDRWIRGADGKKIPFAGSGTNAKTDPRLAVLTMLPFGHGKRSCVGRRFAEMELYVCVAKVLQKLRIAVDPQYEGLKTIYTPFVTPINPIPFIFSKR